MNDTPRDSRSLESLRKEAKRWLAALRAGVAEARARYEKALGAPPDDPTLRGVQHALARERGFDGWSAMKAATTKSAPPAIAGYEERAHALLDAYTLGTPEAMERHYALTWHRRAWPTMRTYVQLDLGKRPAHPGDDVPLTIDDARHHVAVEHGFRDWHALRAEVETWRPGAVMAASPVRLRSADEDDSPAIIASRDWDVVLRELAARPGAVLDANGQMTDDILDQVSRLGHLEVLRIGGSRAVTDDGIRHLARLPHLRHLDLSGTRVTDHGLAVLRELPALESLSLVMTRVTDAGMAQLAACRALVHLNLLWTATGDGAIRALAGMERLRRFTSGNDVTDDGLAALHAIPVLGEWRGGEPVVGNDATRPNELELRGPFTDRGMEHLRGLDGLYGLVARLRRQRPGHGAAGVPAARRLPLGGPRRRVDAVHRRDARAARTRARRTPWPATTGSSRSPGPKRWSASGGVAATTSARAASSRCPPCRRCACCR